MHSSKQFGRSAYAVRLILVRTFVTTLLGDLADFLCEAHTSHPSLIGMPKGSGGIPGAPRKGQGEREVPKNDAPESRRSVRRGIERAQGHKDRPCWTTVPHNCTTWSALVKPLDRPMRGPCDCAGACP